MRPYFGEPKRPWQLLHVSTLQVLIEERLRHRPRLGRSQEITIRVKPRLDLFACRRRKRSVASVVGWESIEFL
jgi:hypothetical protein